MYLPDSEHHPETLSASTESPNKAKESHIAARGAVVVVRHGGYSVERMILAILKMMPPHAFLGVL